jgi:hypothetical protein
MVLRQHGAQLPDGASERIDVATLQGVFDDETQRIAFLQLGSDA